MTDLRKAAEMALEALHNIDQSNNDDAIEALRQALAQEVTGEVPCKTDPRAPHGFDRNASHSADRYVCECESWEPPKREWVGLTDEERRGIREWQEIQKELGPVWAPMMLYLYDAIEAKLKEKNHD